MAQERVWLLPGEKALLGIDNGEVNWCGCLIAVRPGPPRGAARLKAETLEERPPEETCRILSMRFLNLKHKLVQARYDKEVGKEPVVAVKPSREVAALGTADVDIFTMAANLHDLLADWNAIYDVGAAPLNFEYGWDHMHSGGASNMLALAAVAANAIRVHSMRRGVYNRPVGWTQKKDRVPRGNNVATGSKEHKDISIACMWDAVAHYGDTDGEQFLRRVKSAPWKMDDHADSYGMALYRARVDFALPIPPRAPKAPKVPKIPKAPKIPKVPKARTKRPREEAAAGADLEDPAAKRPRTD
jgi:hypothetical protein